MRPKHGSYERGTLSLFSYDHQPNSFCSPWWGLGGILCGWGLLQLLFQVKERDLDPGRCWASGGSNGVDCEEASTGSWRD